MKKTRIGRIVHGYGLLVAVVLAVFVLYKLVDLDWFANVTTPTLAVYSLIAMTALLLLCRAVLAFFHNKKR